MNEQMVNDIVQEVIAKLQISENPTGKHGVFNDMNDAIEAAKEAQKVVRRKDCLRFVWRWLWSFRFVLSLLLQRPQRMTNNLLLLEGMMHL